MGDLRAALRSGEIGVRWTPPEGAVVVEEGPRLLVLRDGDAGVVWQVTTSSMPFALAPDEVLARDLDRSSRLAFEEISSTSDPTAARRTDDPAWSPVIERATLELRGGPALRLVRRVAHQPREIIAGHLVVPIAGGHVDLCLLAGADITGVRESIVTDIRLALDPGAPPPTQAEIDDAARDAHFPDHPLSAVRRNLDALAAALEVSRSAPPVTSAEVVLDGPVCALMPPPRFAPLDAAALGLPARMGLFTRCGIAGWRHNLEVWRYGDVPLPRFGVRRELAALARAVVEKWGDEGAKDLVTTVGVADDFDGRPQVQQWVDMTTDRPSRTLLRWWIEPDGVVYRLGIGGPLPISDAEHLASLDEVQRSWRRLDAVATVRRRWRFW